MSAATPFAHVRLLVLTEGLPELERARRTLAEAHARGAHFAVLVRAYEASRDERVGFTAALRTSLPRAVPVFFAGPPSEALEAGADGVHLGRRAASVAEARQVLGAQAWVSVPAHAPQDIVAAEREGAYAALVSPVLAVPGKGSPLGFSGLSCFMTQAAPTRLRTFALGGLGAADVPACLRAGAGGVAVIRSVWASEDPATAVWELSEALARHG